MWRIIKEGLDIEINPDITREVGFALSSLLKLLIYALKKWKKILFKSKTCSLNSAYLCAS
jgi:hypothetical protein